jgi:predicted NAD-dependent protein-ADP-ribosyltransferase YbiA (DUF1768 family)
MENKLSNIVSNVPENVVPSQPTEQPAVSPIQQNFTDGQGGRKMQPQFEGKSTMDLILSGDRTRTTRAQTDINRMISDYKLNKIEDLVGKVIPMTDKSGRIVDTRITKVARLTQEYQDATWQKEGWEKSVTDKLVGEYPYAIEFELVKPSQQTSADKINIYAGTGENAELSNFAIRPFIHLGINFDSVEQAFQYYKTEFSPKNENNRAVGSVIKDTKDGKRLRELGKEFKGLDQKVWDSMSPTIMKALLKDSFQQNPDALASLLATGNAELTHTQDKGKWGAEFPRLLMEVRAELNTNQPSAQQTENWEEENNDCPTPF